MSKVFYDHLVGIENITALVDQDMADLIDNTMHHHILDEILTHLPVEHHKTFLERLAHAPHDPGILIFIQEVTVIDIEKAIKNRAKSVKKELLRDIKSSRKK
ncbi:MAG: hypothetical protein UU34_C0015G0013 [Candidatus Curtissbacteria bacterium GW2011_GWA1_41_11]|uniref:Uncharacterized protein n=1 Tax=Candidatus Curtissbacteria bacterium GW2011_GWA1_41_11 TaxID=1618409 RepID=A0A0G0UBT0_9BACT|nr:MAG: hypothetical protein UU34_C0015G0013 [Candidatus Curtissbacteria bacterium GW2011_GWA1_41_11]